MEFTLKRKPEEISKRFYRLRSQRDLARLLEVDYKVLHYYTSRLPIAANYEIFEIPKKSGGKRRIAAPSTNFKILLTKLNTILQIVFERRKRPSVHGFTYERSIVTNAQPHVGSKYVLNVDIEDFFPSITHKRIRGLFKAKPYNLPYRMADTLAKLVCLNGYLPQGSPCSPVVANLICTSLDRKLQNLAKRHGCFYTRYADDITFSTKRAVFPSALAILHSTQSGVYTQIGGELNSLIEENGFSLNSEKTRLQNQYSRQEVTGLTVNEFVNVRREYVSQIRSMLYAWQKFGETQAEREYNAVYLDKESRSEYKPDHVSFREVLHGKLAFLSSVRGKNDPIVVKYMEWFKELADPSYTRIIPTPPINVSTVGKIFVSHSSKDDIFTDRVYSELKRRGFMLWLDRMDMKAGNWPDQIDQALKTCEIMILIVSPSSLASKHVNDEWQNYHAADKQIIPIVCKQVDEKNYHYQISQMQRIDFTSQSFTDALDQLVLRLSS